MDFDQYIKAALQEHLSNIEIYQTTKKIVRELSEWHSDHNKSIAKGELIFLRWWKNKATRKCSQIYLTIKMHNQLWKTQPVVSACSTYLYALSCWVDFHLQGLTSLVPICLRDSHHLIDDLHQLDTLPVTAHFSQRMQCRCTQTSASPMPFKFHILSLMRTRIKCLRSFWLLPCWMPFRL